MLWPSDVADCLRAIGHSLDEIEAAEVQLEERDTDLVVRCTHQGIASETRYSSVELRALLEAAYARRGQAEAQPPSGWEEKLRAVGQDLERKKAKDIQIVSAGDAFTTRYFQRGEGSVRASYVPAMYTTLSEVGKRRRRQDI